MQKNEDQRNLIIFIVLMLVFFFGYQQFVLGPQENARRIENARRQAEIAKQQKLNPTPQQQSQVDASGIERADPAQSVKIDGKAVDGSISLKGARIDNVRLKDFYETITDKELKRPGGEVKLLQPVGDPRAFYAVVSWTGIPDLPGDNAIWTQTSTGPLTSTNPLLLSWTGTSTRIDRTIAIDDNYMFRVSDTVSNTSAAPITIWPVSALRQQRLPEHLTTPPSEQQAHRGVLGMYADDKKNQTISYADLAKKKEGELAVNQEADKGWIALTTKYWMAAAVPTQGEPVTMLAAYTSSTQTFMAGFKGQARTIAPGASATATSQVFAGAKVVNVLDHYQNDEKIPWFTDAVDWSWLSFITKPFFWLLKMFDGWFGSFGLSIIALTLCVKTVFFPIQWNMYKSMAKMRKLQPEVEELRKRFDNDKQRQQQEILKLYQREKANPLSGCLPMIPQMFVFFALYHTLMVAIEMRHTPFYGWVRDMSAPDPTTIFNLFGLIPWDPSAIPIIGGFLHIGVWPILYGATMWLLQGMSAPATDPTQRAIMRFLPLVFLVLFAGVAAGLAIYWTASNLITLGQQYFIMRRQGVETEFDKLWKKYFGKKKPEAASS